jgi:periplasmic protein TonB
MHASSANAPGQYTLSDDLAKLCLPAATHDANRKLAYVNSICLAFLVVGLVGLKMPQPYVRPLPEVVDVVPVVFIPPDQPPPQQQDVPQDQPEEVRDAPLDAPVVATVVAADPSAVKFAVPVSGPVILAPARFAAAPPPQTKAPPPVPKPTQFVPSTTDGGSYPEPPYPPQALREKMQGTVRLSFMVDASGTVTSAEVELTSGYPLLDRHVVQWIKNNYRFPPGATRAFYRDFKFQMK